MDCNLDRIAQIQDMPARAVRRYIGEHMKEHRFKEGDRVTTANGRVGTVVQVSSTQPHITWVRWDDERGWKMIGTAYITLDNAET